MADMIYLEAPYEVADRPLEWQKHGLQQTASGYGRKLTSTRVLRIAGEKLWRRIYVICYSNAGTSYVLIKGIPHYLKGGA